MLFTKKTLSDIDLKDKRVLLRADYNVPLNEDGTIADDYRMRQSLPTIHALLEQHCSVVVMSHLGRPDGEAKPEFSLENVSKHLGELLGQEVLFAHDCIGDDVVRQARGLQHGQVMMVENVRYHYEEEVDDKGFAEELAKLGDVFVQDAFGVVHRAHASTNAITQFLPSVSGLLLEREVRELTRAIMHPKRPLVAIVGGAKIETKIELLDNLMTVANRLIISGAMSNTFLKAMGMEIGKSLYDETEIEVAKKVIGECRDKNIELILPLRDVAVSKSADDSAERREVPTEEVAADDIILDFGQQSINSVTHNLEDAGTVIWNGPFGMIELPNFRAGSEAIANYIVDNQIDCVVGGGDTVELIDEMKLIDKFTHVSTGGGASLELLSGMKLPGIEALQDK